MPAAAIEAKPVPAMRVADLAVGGAGELVGIDLEAGSSELLAAMGLRPGCLVTMCRRGHSCVVRVCDGSGGGCRVGMSRELAAGLRIAPTESGGE